MNGKTVNTFRIFRTEFREWFCLHFYTGSLNNGNMELDSGNMALLAETWVLKSEFIFLIFLNSWALKFSSSLLTAPIIRNESPKAYHLVQFQKNLIHRFRDKFKKPTIYWWFKGQVKLAQFQKNLIHRFREKFKEVDFGPKMAHFGHKNFL